MLKSKGNSLTVLLRQITSVFLKRIQIISYIFKWFIAGVIIAFFIGSASAVFLISLDWVTNYREANEWIIYFLPISGFLVGIVYHYYGKGVEGGNNLLIDTIHTPAKHIPFKMAILVYFSTIITHLFGGSAGREGTALQMAGSIADQFSKPLKIKSLDRSILITAAVAAGFGSIFGTPLAGTIFGLEFFLIGKIRYNAIFPALIASVVSDSVCKFWGVNHIIYQINSIVPHETLLNIFYAIFAGLIFGLCAKIFSKTLEKLSEIIKSKIPYSPLSYLLGGAIIVVLVLLVGTTKYIGLGVPTIVESFNVKLPLYSFILKIIFTIITLSAGFKGGEVTPLFFIGATLGNALSYFIPLPMGLLVGMGFVSVLSGATNTPIACSIMAIELFGIEYAVFTSISCITAYLVSGNTSIYGRQMVGVAKNGKSIENVGKRINEI